jgi:hypothetical protein
MWWFFSKTLTYQEFIKYIRNEHVSIQDRIHYFYNNINLFSEEIQKKEYKEDRYFISDLLVKEFEKN